MGKKDKSLDDGKNQPRERRGGFAEAEKEILEYWQENRIFEKSLEKTKRGKKFVFYEGPPTANGKPGIHHVEGRSFKDVILRFKVMQGFGVPRIAGWDTHGLPVEVEVEKELGLKSKKEIEEYGIEKFNRKCKESVWKYQELWERLTDRMGFWIDMKNPYITYKNSYIEKLWELFADFHKNKLLFKDYKVLPWCPRCGTSLSSHELAQGYQKIRDESVYVKFKIKSAPNKYFLVWTTTPWTLPGNVALAINPKVKYVEIKEGKETLILAKDRLPDVLGDMKHEIVAEKSGKDYSGVQYEIFYYHTGGLSEGYVVFADFVTTDEGTGIVHIAPAFGADDQKTAKENNLPTLLTLSEDGRMNTPKYPWHKKPFEEANGLISADLKKRGLLFKKEPYEHDYPFCWRCKSKLVYFAISSWFLKTTAVKSKMLSENKKIGWHPEFIGRGRFGEWLRENVDWAVSRKRFWGTPLPIWICQNDKVKNAKQKSGCGYRIVTGSLKELDKNAPGTFKNTKVFVMRHGEAQHNIKGIVGPVFADYDLKNNLTKKGEAEIKKTAKKLKKEKIDLIISSSLLRAKKTAQILSKELGIKHEVSGNIHDIDVGELHGTTVKELRKRFSFEERLINALPKGESLRGVRTRMVREIKKITQKHEGKKIIIVSHGDPLWVLDAALSGKEEQEYKNGWYPKTGEVKELKLHNWPYSESGELDLHRPYVDEIILECPKCGEEMKRIEEVADAWYDSGSMPFASDAPGYPADYIVEGVDQTRGWFYSLLAVASLSNKKAPYKNVLSYGHVLDGEGKKMSKSVGNIVDPFMLFEKYGADAVRWYFYTVNQPWDSKLFREEDVADAGRRFLNIFWNSFVYWMTYKDKSKVNSPAGGQKAKFLINKWLQARLNQIGYEVTEALEKYDIVRAARMIENFVTEDLSRWYIRRIRDQIRFGKKNERKEISDAFGLALYGVSKLAAPFIPFLTDRMFLEVMKKNSIHLDKWAKFKKPTKADLKMVEEMNEARRIVSLALEARAKAGIKVRQPLAELRIMNKELRIKHNKELQDLIKGEVNIKEIKFDPKIKDEVELDTLITPELKEEGELRELIRQIQNGRKKAGLQPSDKITFVAITDDKGVAFVRKFESTLKKEAGIKQIVFGEGKSARGLQISLRFGI